MRPTICARTAERGDVVRGVARPARENLRRVVLKNEDRRFTRHARDAAVDEFIGDQIADDRDPARRKRVEQADESRLVFEIANGGQTLFLRIS